MYIVVLNRQKQREIRMAADRKMKHDNKQLTGCSDDHSMSLSSRTFQNKLESVFGVFRTLLKYGHVINEYF